MCYSQCIVILVARQPGSTHPAHDSSSNGPKFLARRKRLIPRRSIQAPLMYELNCPDCDAINPVSPAKAGGEITCAACDRPIPVPKLGELKRLPTSGDRLADAGTNAAARGLSGGRSMAFAALGAISLACFLGAAFCGLNWATTEVLVTTDSHVADVRETYQQLSSARLIREYEDITELGVEVTHPYPYRVTQLNKQAWANKALAFAAAGIVAAIASVFVGRRQRT